MESKSSRCTPEPNCQFGLCGTALCTAHVAVSCTVFVTALYSNSVCDSIVYSGFNSILYTVGGSVLHSVCDSFMYSVCDSVMYSVCDSVMYSGFDSIVYSLWQCCIQRMWQRCVQCVWQRHEQCVWQRCVQYVTAACTIGLTAFCTVCMGVLCTRHELLTDSVGHCQTVWVTVTQLDLITGHGTLDGIRQRHMQHSTRWGIVELIDSIPLK